MTLWKFMRNKKIIKIYISLQNNVTLKLIRLYKYMTIYKIMWLMRNNKNIQIIKINICSQNCATL